MTGPGRTRRAIVVGGGIGGLAAGRALLATGWDVTVHERSAGFPTHEPGQGTALGMWPDTMDSLATLGLADSIRQQAPDVRAAHIMDPSGRTLVALKPSDSALLVPRPRLHAALGSGELASRIQWGSTITDVRDLDADLVVGADGIHSSVRTHVARRQVDPRPLDSVAFRGVVAGEAPGFQESWGQGRLFGITGHSAGHTNWFACLRTSLIYEAQTPADQLRALYAGWYPSVATVLEALRDDAIDLRHLHDLPRLSSYVRGNVALLGDAAHAMAPNLGRGGSEAITDAVTLASTLAESSDTAEGLRRYDRLRRPPTQRLVLASRFVNRLATAHHGIGLRNRAMRVAGRFS